MQLGDIKNHPGTQQGFDEGSNVFPTLVFFIMGIIDGLQGQLFRNC